MELNDVEITNYKSIKDQRLYLNPNCRVLVGINESGKTNVMEALSHLDVEREIQQMDIREPYPDEGEIEKSFVRYNFHFDKKDHDQMSDELYDDLLFSSDEWILEEDGKQYKFKDMFQFFKKAMFETNFKKEKKTSRWWTVNRTFKVNENWMKVKAGVADTVTVETEDEGNLKLNDFKFINVDDFEIPESQIESFESDAVLSFISQYVTSYIDENLPKVVYWKYNSDYLLPGSISLADFKSDPNMCLPLKNMFELADVVDITKSIEDAEAKSSTGLRNLLNRVADKATKHLRKIWKEYKHISIELSPNGSFIDASIKDAFNNYEFEKRSDGFKRFVSFLLFVSIKNATTDLMNDLILVDEPEIGLHPSGAKFLRDELLKISKNNKVIYSTHSIFMVDREYIGRHLIVKKINEVTSLIQVHESNMFDEEVIYNALGSSAFEVLKDKNIIFEGWRDKNLFKVGLTLIKTSKKDVFEVLSKVGISHSKGVKHIKNITPLLEMANKKCWIVSDSDQVAKEEKSRYEGFGTWLTYLNIDTAFDNFTGEDFLKIDAFKKPLKVIENRYKGKLSSFDVKQLEIPGDRIKRIESWLKHGKVEKSLIKNELDELKSSLFDNLKKTQIDVIYTEFLEKLSEKIEEV